MIATDQSCYGTVDGNDGSIYIDIQGGLNPSYTLDWYEYRCVPRCSVRFSVGYR